MGNFFEVIRKFIMLDLERPSDRALLQDAERFFDLHSDKTICLDEIQNAPELFQVLRYVVDNKRQTLKEIYPS